MALIICSECGKEISRRAKQCPGCGVDRDPDFFSKLIGIPVLLIGFVSLMKFEATHDRWPGVGEYIGFTYDTAAALFTQLWSLIG